MPAPDPQLPLLIQNQADLDALCELIAQSDSIALDTEFVRTRTYKPHLGLLQIAAGDNAVCVDPLADIDCASLWPLLFDKQRTNIMHSASQDLEVMWFHTGGIQTNLIDTQVCAALLNFPPQIGYAALVADIAGVALSKEQTRTDWTRRPLTAEQIDYAAKDVVYLDGMHAVLKDRLEALGRYQWAIEDSAALCRTALYEPDIENAWQRIKSIPFLPGDQQARAMALAEWREARAVTLDKPRGWVVEDKTVLAIAAANPGDEKSLEGLADVPDGLARRQGSYLLRTIAEANERFAAEPERYVQQFKDRDADKALSKKLGQIVRNKAAELDLPAEVLGSKREITAVMRGDSTTKLLSGWRRSIVGDELLAAL